VDLEETPPGQVEFAGRLSESAGGGIERHRRDDVKAAVDEPELADLDPFELMAAEADRIDRFYRGLRDAEWRAPTRCPGWTRRDLLAHLAGVEDYTAAGLAGDVRALMSRSGTNDMDDFNRWGIGQRAYLSNADLLREWRALVDKNDTSLRERGPRAELDTSIGPYPVGRQAFYLACERAIHADDAGVPITRGEAENRLDWRLRFARAAVTEARGGRVGVVADRGAQTVRLGEDEVRLPDEQFVAAVSGRLAPEFDLSPRMREALAVLA
jgi:uncharacterized protein (TIGR03083 family)